MKRILSFLCFLVFSFVNISAQNDSLKTSPNISIHGFIRDSKQKSVVPFAFATLFELKEDGTFVEITKIETEYEAYFSFSLEADKFYQIVGSSREYLPNEINIETIMLERDSLLEKDIFIESQPYDMSERYEFVLLNIYFDSGSPKLTEEMRKELDKTVKILKKNPDITLELKAHLDISEQSGGNENMPSSKLRLENTINYMVSKGIERERLRGVWLERSFPIYKEAKNEVERKTNRRIEFKIIYPK